MRIMRAFVLIIILGGVDCYTGSTAPPCPVNVTFTSLNLRNVLQWVPGNETPKGTRYTVQLAIYGDRLAGTNRVNWRPVLWCKETERTWCDLSREMWDMEQGYYARVRAVGDTMSNWVVTSMRFNPKADTTFGQPQISVEVKDNNAIVFLSGPIRYQPDNLAPPISMAALYPQMMYNLTVTHQGKVHHFPVTSSPYKYKLMDFEAEYCFSAKVRFLSLHNKCQESERLCITTDKDPVTNQVQLAVIGIVVPSLCICILLVVGYILYHYLMGNERKIPRNLEIAPLHSQPTKPFLPDSITPLKSLYSSDNDDEDNNAWDCVRSGAVHLPQPPPELAEFSDDSSSYGAVGVSIPDDGGKCNIHHEESDDKDATLPATQCSLPQEQSKRPLENVTQTQMGFSTTYLTNTTPNVLGMPVTEMNEVAGSAYWLREKDKESSAYPDPTAENYSVLVPTVVEQGEDFEPLCIEWDREKRKLVLPGLKMALKQVEGEGGVKKMANDDPRLENCFGRQASQEEAGPQQGATAGLEEDDLARKWGLVISGDD